MEDYYKEKNQKKHRNKIIKTILIKLIYILVLPIILWNLAIILQTLQNPNDTPSVFGIKTFCIISGSMEPNIQINDMVIVKEVQQNEINKDDIITFVVNGDTITHRVIDVESRNGVLLYTTQGDANNIEDEEKITFENIEGKYIGKIPKVGKIVLALKSKTTLAIVLSILILLYIIEQRINNKKIKRNKERIKYEQDKEK